MGAAWVIFRETLAVLAGIWEDLGEGAFGRVTLGRWHWDGWRGECRDRFGRLSSYMVRTGGCGRKG